MVVVAVWGGAIVYQWVVGFVIGDLNHMKQG